MAQKLYPTGLDKTKLGAVRRAMRSLEAMGYLMRDAAGLYRRTSKRQPVRREWFNAIGPDRIEPAEASAMLSGEHYLGAIGWNVSYCLATPARDALATFSPPVAYPFTAALGRPLELSRLWRANECPFQSSQFLAAALKWIKRVAPEVPCIFSYADPTAHNSETGRAHNGGVYVAANFRYLGKSEAMPHWIRPDGSHVSAKLAQRRLGTKGPRQGGRAETILATHARRSQIALCLPDGVVSRCGHGSDRDRPLSSHAVAA